MRWEQSYEYLPIVIYNYRVVITRTLYIFLSYVATPHKNKATLLVKRSSETRSGDFLHFGQPFKAGGDNFFTQITHIVRQLL